MGWIKRNLFFSIGGAVALLLMGAGGFYIYNGWSRNSAAATQLNEIYGNIKKINQEKFQPGNNKINNTTTAKEQQAKVQAWIDSVKKFFQPIPAIPAGAVTSKDFATELRVTVDQLQRQAAEAGVKLPPQYQFSFATQFSLLNFAPGSLEPLARQLGEVKAISSVVFAAKVNTLDSIQRVRVCADDAAGPQENYISGTPVTNDLAIITPYVVTIRCFTPELARVLSNFATPSQTFLIRAINVQPAGAAGLADAVNPNVPPPAYGGAYGAYGGAGVYGRHPQYAAPPVVQPAPPAGAKTGPQTVLKEQLLRVTLEVGYVKLLPRN